MKFVALLSGGKDSCFNIVHCTANGHELVAAASLRPPPGQGEIDSFMYQTVGQDAIELVAGALGVPLFRRTIHGSAVEQGSEYGAREGKMDKLEAGVEGDETEDMFNLLSEVKAAHPDIQGVSVGAILSNYQRVRVDHVCQRLSLTPLCYLWQRDQRELMSEMIQAGVEAILIKVAGIGLQERHLGKTLAQMEPTFHKLHDMYGAHICGEGGEYETLTLDCPAFKRRIRINETKTIVHSDHAFATVAYLEVTNAILEDKLGSVSLEPTIPPLLDETALRIQAALSARQNNPTPEDGPTASQTVTIEPKIHVTGPWAYISDVQGDLPPKESVEDEVVACFDKIKELLLRHNLQPKHITNTMLLLSSMDLFPQVNKAYGQYFGTSPPSRACVAVDLPLPTRVRVACVAFRDDVANQRTGLHVQGISYWAPANIGPYSQAIVVQDQIFISGQIGLIPASMTFPSPPSFATEAALAFQHADRILAALKDGPTAQLQGVIVWVAGNEKLELGRLAWDAYSKERGMRDVPAITVAAKTLPKGAMIEVQVLAHSNRDSDKNDEVKKVNTNASSIRSEYFGLSAKTARDKSTFSVVVARNQGMKEALKAAAVVSAGKQTLSVQVFYTPDTDIEQLSYALDGFACTHIPIRGVLG
ncbi:diphthamide biosynthesis protein [Ceratobasidium sp. AG-Ba]|nr:diphthamide biosynthesis protein [Ceratobasidium sp. AG-Ba]